MQCRYADRYLLLDLITMKAELLQLIKEANCIKVELGDDKWGEPDHFAKDSDLVPGSEPKVYSFDQKMSGARVVEEMEKDGYRPGTTADLLTYAANNSDSLLADLCARLNELVALGTVSPVGGGLGTVPRLCTVHGKLYLGTECFAGPRMSLPEYPKSTLYIAVRK